MAAVSELVDKRRAHRLDGVLMGWGSLLIPGSNDGLILIGIPLLQPHAWFALATMCASIAIALAVTRAWSARTRTMRCA